jgi:hypothetical protein
MTRGHSCRVTLNHDSVIHAMSIHTIFHELLAHASRVVVIAVAIACAPSKAKPAPHFRVEFEAPSEVVLGDSARLRLTLVNDSPVDIRLEFWGNNGTAFDPIVEGMNGERVWRWSDGKAFGGTGLLTTLRAADSTQFAATWPLIDGNGKPVPPGTYELVALLKGSDGKSFIGDGHRRRMHVITR